MSAEKQILEEIDFEHCLGGKKKFFGTFIKTFFINSYIYTY